MSDHSLSQGRNPGISTPSLHQKVYSSSQRQLPPSSHGLWVVGIHVDFAAMHMSWKWINGENCSVITTQGTSQRIACLLLVLLGTKRKFAGQTWRCSTWYWSKLENGQYIISHYSRVWTVTSNVFLVYCFVNHLNCYLNVNPIFKFSDDWTYFLSRVRKKNQEAHEANVLMKKTLPYF